MDDFEKQIYNTYLIVSRSIINKPFKIRKDFTGFEKKREYLAVVKLAAFFKKHRHLNVKSFFEAPFFVYEEDYFGIDFFCTHKAVSTYTKYNDIFLVENPDSAAVGGKIKESIVFITNYCKTNNIKIRQYIMCKETGSQSYAFLGHLKDRKINVYVLFAFRDFESILNIIDVNIKKIFAPSLMKVDYLRTKMYSSVQMKKNVNLFKKFVDNQ